MVNQTELVQLFISSKNYLDPLVDNLLPVFSAHCCLYTGFYFDLSYVCLLLSESQPVGSQSLWRDELSFQWDQIAEVLHIKYFHYYSQQSQNCSHEVARKYFYG